MKFLILLLLIFPKLLLAQEVLIDSSNKEYLYLGSTQISLYILLLST